jgi:DNA-binding transcriptional regulator YhcF (GntR family)
MENNKRHVQVPNDMTIAHTISPKDLLIYTAIKRYANKDGISYPSLKRISEDSGAAINTIRKSISLLEKEGYIEIDKSKKNNIYHCKKYDNFEPFSYEFLDKKDLSFTDKAYYIASQQYMIKDNNEGKISFTNKELAKVINTSESTISRCNKNLQDKGYLTILDTKMKDLETALGGT